MLTDRPRPPDGTTPGVACAHPRPYHWFALADGYVVKLCGACAEHLSEPLPRCPAETRRGRCSLPLGHRMHPRWKRHGQAVRS